MGYGTAVCAAVSSGLMVARGGSRLGVARRRSLRYTARAVAPVAQLDRAPDYESGGWKFESFRARHRPRSPLPTGSGIYYSSPFAGFYADGSPILPWIDCFQNKTDAVHY